MMTTSREVELELQFLRKKYQELDSKINSLLNVENEWISVNKAASLSLGKLSAHQIRCKIEATIKSPTSSDLIEEKHFSKVISSIGICRYKVLWPDFSKIWSGEERL